MTDRTLSRATSQLFDAIQEEDSGAVIKLLAAGVPANASKDGTPAILAAAISGDSRTIAALLDSGADPNVQVQKHRHPELTTPLIAASAHAHRSAMELLLERGADPTPVTREGKTAAHHLFSALSGNRRTPLWHAFVERVLITMFEKGLSASAVDNDGLSLLDCALDGTSPLSTFKTLLDHGADPNIVTQRDSRIIHNAVYSRRPDVVRLLVKSGVSIDTQDKAGRSPLFACFHDDPATAEMIFSLKPDLNLQDFNGDTALHYYLATFFSAQPNETCPRVERLLAAGASACIANKRGQLPKDIIEKRHLESMKGLVGAAMAREAIKSVTNKRVAAPK